MTSQPSFKHLPHRVVLLHSWYRMTVSDFLFLVGHENETLNVVSVLNSSCQINLDWFEEDLSML